MNTTLPAFPTLPSEPSQPAPPPAAPALPAFVPVLCPAGIATAALAPGSKPQPLLARLTYRSA